MASSNFTPTGKRGEAGFFFLFLEEVLLVVLLLILNNINLNMLQARHMFLLSVGWMKMLMRKCYAMNFLNMLLLRFEKNHLFCFCGVWLLVCYFVLTINILPLQDLRLVRDKFTHVSRGFAFIHFYSVSITPKIEHR